VSKVVWLADSFKNFLANLGTGRDKASSGHYGDIVVDDLQLNNAYRGSWLPRKIVDIPALDATRKWRNWQANKDEITKIDAEEKRLDLKAKVKEAVTMARLFGGAGIYISIKGDRDPSLPLNIGSVGLGGVDFLTVLPRRVLTAGELETDPATQGYGKPKFYTISSKTGATQIHPSRIAAFIGNPHPDPELASGLNFGWGDSVLTSSFEPVRNCDATMSNIASLVYEAKVDVLGIPGLADIMADPKQRELLVERAQLSAMLKGNNGMMVRDADETYDQKSYAFAGLEPIANLFMQVASGAADVPMTRLFGQSPAGMSATGESDLRNYYDRVNSGQELDITPALANIDECLIRSALGSRPAEIFYTWASLWQTTGKERAEIGKIAADTIKTLKDSALFPDEVLSKAGENMLIELGVMPGLEAAREEYEALEENDDVL